MHQSTCTQGGGNGVGYTGDMPQRDDAAEDFDTPPVAVVLSEPSAHAQKSGHENGSVHSAPSSLRAADAQIFAHAQLSSEASHLVQGVTHPVA